MLPDVFDSRNQRGNDVEFLYFSRGKVDMNQCDKKLSSDTSVLWKKW